MIAKLKHSDSSITGTTAESMESASIMTSPAEITIPSGLSNRQQQPQSIVATSAQHELQHQPMQPLLYTSTNSMYRSMFMPQRMSNAMPVATLTSNFSNFFSRKMIAAPAATEETEDPPPSMISPSRFLASTPESPRRRKQQLIPCSPISTSSASPATPPASPYRSMTISPRILLNTTNMKQSNNKASSNDSVSSNNSNFTQARIPEAPKIRARVKNIAHGLANATKKKQCASCVCRDQKLVEQRKEIDHLKGIVKDLLVMSLEAKNKGETDDDSLEDLPTFTAASLSPPKGDLLQVSDLALTPGPRSFEEDPEDPLKSVATVSSSSAMIQMSHSLRIKQSFKRGSPSKKPKKIRHLRIQVNGKWGYYSGPVPEKDVPLVGCVLRFDNGDLYLGNMENSCLHGPGTLYPKAGSGQVLRGNFEWGIFSSERMLNK